MHAARKKKVKRMIGELQLMVEELEGVIKEELTIYDKLDSRSRDLRIDKHESDISSLDISRLLITDTIEELSKIICD